MAFQSEFTGEQMEEIFRKAAGMTVGSAVAAASSNGHGNVIVENASGGNGNPLRAFVSVRRSDYGSSGAIIPIASYAPQNDSLSIHIYGDGVRSGGSYTVDYLLI